MNAARVRFYESLYNGGQKIPELRHFYNYFITGGKALGRRKRQTQYNHDPAKKRAKPISPPKKHHDLVEIFAEPLAEEETQLSSLSEEENEDNETSTLDPPPPDDEETQSSASEEETQDEEKEEEETNQAKIKKKFKNASKKKNKEEEEQSQEEESASQDDKQEEESASQDDKQEEESDVDEVDDDTLDPCEDSNLSKTSAEEFLRRINDCIQQKLTSTQEAESSKESEDQTESDDQDELSENDEHKDHDEEYKILCDKIAKLEKRLGIKSKK